MKISPTEKTEKLLFLRALVFYFLSFSLAEILKQLKIQLYSQSLPVKWKKILKN